MGGGEQAGGDRGGAAPHPSPRIFDVVVVGAGISGLVAAYRLQRAGLSVQVVEAAARAGGVIGSVARDGCLFERGPNSALDTTPLIGELVAALGLSAQMHFAAPTADKRYVVRNGVLDGAADLARRVLLDPAVLGVGQAGAAARALRRAASAPEAEESIAEFVRRRLGTEFLDYAIDPFVAGIYAGDPEQISVRAAFPKLHALEQRWGSLIRGQILGARERKRQKEAAKNTAHSFSFAGGMQQLTDALAVALGALALKARVTRLSAMARVCSRCRPSRMAWPSRGAPARCCWQRRADTAAALLREHAADAAAALDSIVYAPVATVASAYALRDIAHALDGFGCLVPRKEAAPRARCAVLEQHVRRPRARGHGTADHLRRRATPPAAAAAAGRRDRRSGAPGTRRLCSARAAGPRSRP